MKINVIWSGWKPQYRGDSEQEILRVQEGGIAVFESGKAFNEFLETMSVGFGESQGNFQHHGGWIGDFEDLRTGKRIYLKPSQLEAEFRGD